MSAPTSANVFIGLGSNLGDRVAYLQQALVELNNLGLQVLQVSRLYETPPWGVVEQPWFLNAVASATSAESPVAVLHLLLEAERRLGRERVRKWGPRIIDLDLLAHGSHIKQNRILTVPHPQLHQRAFVLIPWAEIAPQYCVPGYNLTVQQLLDKLYYQNPTDVYDVREAEGACLQIPVKLSATVQ